MNFMTYIKNVLFVYAPVVGKEKNDIRQLRVIINRLKKKDNQLFNPVQCSFSPVFREIFLELFSCLERIQHIYKSNMGGSDDQREEFERFLTSLILQKKKQTLQDFLFDSIQKQMQLEKKDGGVRAYNTVFEERLKLFSDRNFESFRKGLEKNEIFSVLTLFNSHSILDHFYETPKGGIESAMGEELGQGLLDLYYLTSSLSFEDEELFDPVMMAAFKFSDLGETYSESSFLDDLNQIQAILRDTLNTEYLKNVLRVINRNPELDPSRIKVVSNFPKELYDRIKNEYKKSYNTFVQKKNHMLLLTRMQSLFGDRELISVKVYTSENSNLFHGAGLPVFKYINPMCIIKSFQVYFWEPEIMPALREIQLEAGFESKLWKEKFHGTIDNYVSLQEKIVRFEEDLVIPAYSEIHHFLEALSSGFLDNAGKANARKAVDNLNKKADQIIQETFDTIIILHTTLDVLVVDINAKSSKILNNAMFLKHKRNELCLKLEESAMSFKKYIHLMRSFSIHVADIKDGIHKPEEQ